MVRGIRRAKQTIKLGDFLPFYLQNLHQSTTHNIFFVFICLYAGDLGPDDVLISTNVDEIMSRFHFFPILPCKCTHILIIEISFQLKTDQECSATITLVSN